MVTLNGLLLGLLLTLGTAAAARAQSATTSAPDSATAIKRLFRLRRQGMSAGVGLAVGCGSVAPGAAATTPAEGGRMVLPPSSTAGLGTNCSLHKFFSLMRFSPKREQQVLEQLAHHQQLPAYVRRSLGPVLASTASF